MAEVGPHAAFVPPTWEMLGSPQPSVERSIERRTVDIMKLRRRGRFALPFRPSSDAIHRMRKTEGRKMIVARAIAVLTGAAFGLTLPFFPHFENTSVLTRIAAAICITILLLIPVFLMERENS